MVKALRASVLVFLFARPAYAGEMQNDVKQPPPPVTVTQAATTHGYMQNEEPESLTEAVLAVLGSVLALF